MKVAATFLISLAVFAAFALYFVQIPRAQEQLIIYYGWGSPNSPVNVRPGYTNQPFVVVLQPNANYKFASLNLSGTPFTNVSGGSMAYSVPSQSSTFYFYLNVNKSASAGKYTAKFTLTFLNGSHYYDKLYIPVSPPPAVAIETAYWGEGSSFPTPGSGLQELTLVVGNPDQYPVSFVNVSFNLPYGLSTPSGISKAYAFIPFIGPGSYQTASVLVNITPYVKPSTYIVNYTLSYEDHEGVTYNIRGSFNITVYQQSEVYAFANPVFAPQNSIATARLAIYNEGNTSVNSLQVNLESSLQVIQSNYSSLNYLLPHREVIYVFNFTTQSLPPGIYDIAFRVSYLSPEGLMKTQLVNTYLQVTPEIDYVNFKLFPTTIYYQRNNTVYLTFDNPTGQNVSDLKVYVQQVSGIYINNFTGYINLGNLKAYSEKTVKLFVLPEVDEPEVLPLSVEVTYLNPFDIYQQESFNALLFVSGTIKISFISLTYNSSAYNGSTVTISGSVLNSGTEEAYYGSLIFYAPSFGENVSTYIGDLPVDSPTPFSVSLQVPSSTKPGLYTVYLTYAYQDPYGNFMNYTTALPLEVYIYSYHTTHPEKTYMNYIFEFLLLALILVFIVTMIICLRRK